MIFYYDNTGKLVTITPHGEIPRQGGAMVFEVLLNKDFNSQATDPDGFFDGLGLQNRMMKVRFKAPKSLVFSEDYIMTKSYELYTFHKLPGENIGALIDGEEYYRFTVDLTDTYANKEAGNLEVVFTLLKYIPTGEDTDVVADSRRTFQMGKATVYVEETLGISPWSGIGMTFSEYTSLMAFLNQLQDDVTLNRVGLLKVGEYNEATGEIDIYYDSDIVESLSYDEDTGILTVTW